MGRSESRRARDRRRRSEYLAKNRVTVSVSDDKSSIKTVARTIEDLDPLGAELQAYNQSSIPVRPNPLSRIRTAIRPIFWAVRDKSPLLVLPKFTSQIWGKTNAIVKPTPRIIGGIPGFISRPNRGSSAAQSQEQMIVPVAAKTDLPTINSIGRIIVVRRRRRPVHLSDSPPVVVIDHATPEQRRRADAENKENRVEYLKNNLIVPTRHPTRPSKPFAPPAVAPTHEVPTESQRRPSKSSRLRDPRLLMSAARKIRIRKGETRLNKTKLWTERDAPRDNQHKRAYAIKKLLS